MKKLSKTNPKKLINLSKKLDAKLELKEINQLRLMIFFVIVWNAFPMCKM